MASDKLLQQLFLQSVDVIFSLSVPEGLVLSLSPAFKELTGWSEDKWIGRPFLDIIHPEDRQHAIKSFAERLSGGGPGPYIWRVNTKDGRSLIAEFTSVLVRTKGEVTSIIGIARDISERHKVKNELERRSRQVMHILESISDGFYLLDNEWRYVMLNKTAEELVGKPGAELIDKNFWDVRSPKLVSSLQAKFHAAKDTGKVMVFEEHDMEKDLWYEIRAYPHEDGLAVYFTDISVRKRAEQQLKKHNEGVEKILADILGIQNKWS